MLLEMLEKKLNNHLQKMVRLLKKKV